MRVELFFVTVVLVLGSCKCGPNTNTQPPPDTRGVWLKTTIQEDHQDILKREPELTQQKFQKMAQTPYNYFRGTGPEFSRDLLDPQTARPNGWSSLPILVIGDPHPENIGTFRKASGEITLEFNDFDAAGKGPAEYDLWRLAVGFEVLDEQIQRVCGASEATIAGYGESIVSEVAATNPADVIFADLVRRAKRDGDAREELTDYTIVEDGARKLVFGELEPAEDGIFVDELVEPTPQEDRLVRGLVERYPNSTLDRRHPGAIKGIARRLGAGVESFPYLRFYVLTEGPTADLGDDLLLEVKEAGGARVVDAQRKTQSSPNLDMWLGWAAEGRMSFRFRERSKYQKGFDAERLQEKLEKDKWTCEDFNVFARSAGRLLGAAHRRAGLARPLTPASQQEALMFAKTYSSIVFSDFQRFRALVNRGAWRKP